MTVETTMQVGEKEAQAIIQEPKQLAVLGWKDLLRIEAENPETKALMTMEVDFSVETMNVKEYLDNFNKFIFNDKLQRNYVWDVQKKSLAMLSVLQKVELGNLKAQVVRKNKRKYKNIIDGKQRGLTFKSFVENKFFLTGLPTDEIIEVNGTEYMVDLNGAYFKDLPQSLQNRIMATNLIIEMYEISDEVKAKLFYRWNNGEALKPSEKRISAMPIAISDRLVYIKNNEVIKSVLTEKAIARNTHSDMVLQTAILIESEGQGTIASQSIDKFIKTVTNEDMDATALAFSFLEDAWTSIPEEDKTALLNKTKVVALGYAAHVLRTQSPDVTPEQFGAWIVKFFNTDKKAKEFNNYAQSATTKPDFVKRRNEILLTAMTAFFPATVKTAEIGVPAETTDKLPNDVQDAVENPESKEMSKDLEIESEPVTKEVKSEQQV